MPRPVKRTGLFNLRTIDMKVGDKIFLKPIGNAARRNRDIIETKISKIGRKYFEVEKSYYGRFFINSLKQDCGDYISNYQGYLSIQEIIDETEPQKIFDEIKQKFNTYFNTIELEKLKKIKTILDN